MQRRRSRPDRKRRDQLTLGFLLLVEQVIEERPALIAGTVEVVTKLEEMLCERRAEVELVGDRREGTTGRFLSNDPERATTAGTGLDAADGVLQCAETHDSASMRQPRSRNIG